MAGHRAFGTAEKRRVVRLVSQGKPLSAAAEQVGFSLATVRRHIAMDPDFANALDEANDVLDDRAEGVLYDRAMDGNMTALQMWLYNRRPERWRDMKTVRQEITGAGGGPIAVAAVVATTLREVLHDGTTRDRALGLVRAVPIADGTPRALGAHGDTIASHGLVIAGLEPAPDSPEASEVPE